MSGAEYSFVWIGGYLWIPILYIPFPPLVEKGGKRELFLNTPTVEIPCFFDSAGSFFKRSEKIQMAAGKQCKCRLFDDFSRRFSSILCVKVKVDVEY